MRKLLTAFLATALLLSLGSAYAATQTHTCTISLATTNWSNSLLVPKFDSSLGTLNAITFTLTGYVEGAAMFENMETVPTDVTVNLSARLTLMRPDSSVLLVTIPVVSMTENVGAYDGEMDFLGASGRTYGDLSANQSETATSTAPSADLALFTGSGNISLPISAEGFSSGEGGGNLLLQFRTLASAHTLVKYDYTPVPEPSGLLAMLTGVGGLAGILARGRRG